MYGFEEIEKVDKEIADCIKAEVERQNSHIELIASENWVSKAVMASMGSLLTNKYAEGYPGKRFYGAASVWTRWSALPSSGRKNCLDASMQMCSRIPARRQIWQFFMLC